MWFLTRPLYIIILLLAACTVASAEESFLLVQVATPKGQPIAGVVLSATGGNSVSLPTDELGKTQIKLNPQIRPGDEIALRLVVAPEDLVLISPWDSRVKVPSLERDSQHYLQVVLAHKGDRALLENGRTLSALASRINTARAAKSIDDTSIEKQRVAALYEVSTAYGLKPEEIDSAIRAWGAKTNDPYEKGLAALYTRNYPEAIRQLAKSVEEQKEELRKSQKELADAYYSLGRSLYKHGSYREAANAFQEAALLRPDNSLILNELGLAQHSAGEYSQAEASYKSALMIDEKLLGPTHSSIAVTLNNLASLYSDQGRYTEAELLYKRTLAILEKNLGRNHHDVEVLLENYASLLRKMNRTTEASQIEGRARRRS